jgi:hypothetical protein
MHLHTCIGANSVAVCAMKEDEGAVAPLPTLLA